MSKKLKFKPAVTRIKLNPEQAVLACNCWQGGYIYESNVNFGKLTDPVITICGHDPFTPGGKGTQVAAPSCRAVALSGDHPLVTKTPSQNSLGNS